MDIGAIFLILAVGLLVGLFVARPFIGRRSSSSLTADDQVLSSLLAERDRLFGALQELDFDFTLGKIPAQDYAPTRAEWLLRASDILRKLDALKHDGITNDDAESRVEAVIAARRADAAVEKSQPQSVSDDEIEELIAARRATRKEKAAGFCPKCGKPVLRSDRFCPSCGKPIS